MPTIRPAMTFLAALAVLLISACGSGDNDTTKVGTTVSYPTGSTDVVLQVESCCGYTSMEYQLSLVPTATIYGDGRTIVSGPVTEQYPPHALPNLLTGHVDRATIVALLNQARADGLLEPLDFGEPPISDYPTTTVTINDGTEHTQAVYALGVEDGEHRTALGLTDAQVQARRRIQDFVTAVAEAAARDARVAYEPQAVAVFVSPAPNSVIDDAVAPGSAAWPLGDLATLGAPLEFGPYRCGVLTGADATSALTAAATATSITRWQSAGAEYTIAWRPLLPAETTCPGLGTGPRLGAAS